MENYEFIRVTQTIRTIQNIQVRQPRRGSLRSIKNTMINWSKASSLEIIKGTGSLLISDFEAFRSLSIFDLKFKQCFINRRNMEILCQSDVLQKVNSLNLQENYFQSDAYSTIFNCSWPQLEAINICKIKRKDPFDLVDWRMFSSKKWPSLKWISICGIMINEDMKLIFAQQWPSLQTLVFNANKLSGARLNWKATKWLQLSDLDLSNNRIGIAGIKQFVKANFSQLKNLCLSYNRLSNQGIKMLTTQEYPSLTTLEITKNRINCDGFKELSKSNWKNLKDLQFGETNISKECNKYLMRASWETIVSITQVVKSIIYIEDNDLAYSIQQKNLIEQRFSAVVFTYQE